jgi:hypothetical protein
MRVVCPSVLVLLLLLVGGSSSAETPPADHWAPIRFLLGSWEGTATGQAGDGTVSRQYAFIMKERFVREVNTSTYLQQERNPQGEVHEHEGIFSYDKARKSIILRQFHIEGFVNQYVLYSESTPERLVFESEHFENFSNEWRARETYDIMGPDEFTETFELASPGKPFETYTKNHFRRVQQ